VALAAVTAPPLVVTLELDPPAQERFERERAEFFPPGRTQVGAHVTLFHAVPGNALAAAVDDLTAAAARAPFPVTVAGLLPLGRGVAYRLVSTELISLHRGLQERWWETLTAQDRQGLRAHVTVQNKVRPDLARATLDTLSARFRPFQAQARGLLLWRYEGGPWTALHRFAFASPLESPPAPSGGVRVSGVFGTDEAPDPVDRRRTAT
jgi:2'-5' RNA ligase